MRDARDARHVCQVGIIDCANGRDMEGVTILGKRCGRTDSGCDAEHGSTIIDILPAGGLPARSIYPRDIWRRLRPR